MDVGFHISLDGKIFSRRGRGAQKTQGQQQGLQAFSHRRSPSWKILRRKNHKRDGPGKSTKRKTDYNQ
jgi:hypothetical protein